MHSSLRHQAGFTLIETIVALMVLTVGIVPAYYLAQSSQVIADSVRDDLIAANLAQEGAEVIHGIRDTNWFSSQSFNNGLGAGNYEVEWNSELPLGVFQDRYLRVDTNGRYNYTTGTSSRFKRKIIITAVGANELKIISQVTWKERARDRTVEVESHLFNWYTP